MNVPLSNIFPEILRQNYDPRDKRVTYLCPFLTMCTGPSGETVQLM